LRRNIERGTALSRRKFLRKREKGYQERKTSHRRLSKYSESLPSFKSLGAPKTSIKGKDLKEILRLAGGETSGKKVLSHLDSRRAF